MSLELGSLYGVWQMRESCGISGHQPRINQLARDGLDAAIEKVLNLIQETKWPVSTPHSIFVGGICLQQPVPRTESLILLGLISYFQPLPATSSHFQPLPAAGVWSKPGRQEQAATTPGLEQSSTILAEVGLSPVRAG